MNQLKATFLSKSDIKAQDLEHKRKLAFNIDKYAETVVKGKQQFAHLDVVREKAKNTKWRAIENLDQHLETFEKNFIKNGGKIEAIKAKYSLSKEIETKLITL